MTTAAPGSPSLAITTVALSYEHDVVLARQRARSVAAHLGFDRQDQVRFATAVSELARNAFQYAREGRVTLALEREGERSLLVARVHDEGSGVPDLERVLRGAYVSSTGMGLGIIGARRLSDRFDIRSTSSGTTVIIGKVIGHAARPLTSTDAARVADELAREDTGSYFDEMRLQNQELVSALDELRASNANLDRLNQELAETNRGVVALYSELDDRAEQLRRMSEGKTRFLSDVSHELRTPLSSIINLSRILLSHADGPLTAEQEKQVAMTGRSAEQLIEMVSGLLDIAKIEAGKVELHVEPFDVEALFASLRGLFRPLVTNANVELIFEPLAEPIPVLSDEQRIAQILRNLISNALKFTTVGEIRVSAERGANDSVSFSVADTGIGITPADQERIFEEFAQVDGPIQRRLRGTGLGLPLTRKLATLLGGVVTLESAPGVGSRFTVTLPRELAPREAADG